MAGTGAGPVSGLDLAPIGDEAPQCDYVLVIYIIDSIKAKIANLRFGDISLSVTPNHVTCHTPFRKVALPAPLAPPVPLPGLTRPRGQQVCGRGR